MALAVAMAGIIATLGLDQITMFLIQNKSTTNVIQNNEDQIDIKSYQNEGVIEKLVSHSEITNTNKPSLSHVGHSHQKSTHDHDERKHNHDYTSSSSSSSLAHNEENISSNNNNNNNNSHPHNHNSFHKKSTSFSELSELPLKQELEVVGHDESQSHAHDHTHTHNMLLITDKNAQRAFVKTLVLEVSIAIHSVIIGVSFGGLGSDSIATIKVLMAALTFHQFFEGISLGSAIAESNLKFPIICFFAFIFAFSFSAGAIIGICTEGPSDTGIMVQGCFNAFAAGSLIYSALVEMMAEDFSSSELNDRLWLKFAMYVFLILGCAAMAILAVYS